MCMGAYPELDIDAHELQKFFFPSHRCLSRGIFKLLSLIVIRSRDFRITQVCSIFRSASNFHVVAGNRGERVNSSSLL